MKSKLIFLLILCNSIYSQKIDSVKFDAHKNRFNTILKNKKPNTDSLHYELAEMVHHNPKVILTEFLSKQQLQHFGKIANDRSNSYVFSHLNLGLGNSNFYQLGPIQALDYFSKAEKAFEKQNDPSCQIFCLLRISSIYSHNIESAALNLKYIEKAITTATKYNDPQLIGQSLGYKGTYFLEHNQYKTALSIFELIEKLKGIRPRDHFVTQFNIGKCYINLGQKNKGIQIFENTLSNLPQNNFNYTDYQIHIRSELIKHYIQNKKLEKVKFHYKQMCYFATSPQINQYEKRWFKNTEYLVQKAMGNYKAALENLELNKIKDDSMLVAQYNQQLEAKKGELSAKEKAILAENESLKSKQETQRQLQWFFIFATIIGSLISLYIIRTNKNLKEKNNQLLVKNKEITAALLQGQTIERQRVAADLHDNLGSTLSALWLSVDAIDKSKMDEEEKEIHQNLRTNLEKAYNDVRLLSHNLLPEELDKQGLVQTLQSFVRQINKNSKIRFELKISEDFDRVANKIEFELYSICLELVNNIIKHSKATEARIELSRTESQVKLLVSDNGIGTFKNDSDGKGIKNVRARVESLNGEWKIKSVDSQGVINEIVAGV